MAAPLPPMPTPLLPGARRIMWVSLAFFVEYGALFLTKARVKGVSSYTRRELGAGQLKIGQRAKVSTLKTSRELLTGLRDFF